MKCEPTEALLIRIPPLLKGRVRKAARKQSLTLSEFVRRTLSHSMLTDRAQARTQILDALKEAELGRPLTQEEKSEITHRVLEHLSEPGFPKAMVGT